MTIRRGWFIVIAALVAVAGSTAGSAQRLLATDYPQWRGAQRDGSASGFVSPADWPEALTLRWKVVVGEGYATPLVIGDAVYTFTRQADREVLTAIDAASGRTRWEAAYDAPYEMFAATAAHGEGPKATPLFHAGLLFTHGIAGAVSAFNAVTGELVWQVPPPDEQPFYGTSVSPIAAGDLVILHPGYGPLTAFQVETGDVVWTAGGDGVYASPIIETLDDVRQVVSVAWRHVEGVSLDGEVLWEFPIDPQMVHAVSPIVYDNTVIITGQNAGVRALRPRRQDERWVVDMVWETPDVSMTLSNPVVIDDTLYGLADRSSGQFFALDARTGEVLWRGASRAAENSAVVKAGDLLFLLNDDAELIVALANRASFERVTRYSVGESATWAQPAISGRRLFVKDQASVALWTLD